MSELARDEIAFKIQCVSVCSAKCKISTVAESPALNPGAVSTVSRTTPTTTVCPKAIVDVQCALRNMRTSSTIPLDLQY